MADELKFDRRSFDELKLKLRDATRSIHDELAGLEATARLLDSGWDGAALEAYQSAHRSWSHQLSEMNDILDRLATQVDTSGEAFAATDRKNARSW